MARFAEEMAQEGEDGFIEVETEGQDDIEWLDDFEYEDEEP